METVGLIRDLEPDYLAALDTLTDIRRDQIDRYICACDGQSDIMILHAYHLGYEKGRLDPLVIKP